MGNRFSDKFLNNVIESAKQRKSSSLEATSRISSIKSNVRDRGAPASEDNLQGLFGNWLDLSDLSTDREPKTRNSNIASFWVSVITFLFS